MDFEVEVRNFIREIEATLTDAEAEIRKATQELQQQVDRKTNEMQPQLKRTIAETTRKTITQLENIEKRLRS